MQRDAESVRGLAHGLGALGLNLTAAQVNRLQELAGKDVLRSIVGMQARAQAAAESPKAGILHMAEAMPSSPSHTYNQKSSHAEQHCVNSRKSMRNFKNLSAEVSGVLKDGSAASAASTLTSRRPTRPRNMSSNDSGPVRALLRPGNGPPDPMTEHLLTPKSPRKRAVPASAKAAFMGKCSKNLIHYESMPKPTPKQIMDLHCKTNIESPNHAQAQGRRRVKTSIIRKITSCLLDTYGEDVSRLQDLFHEADSANKRHLDRADFQRVLSKRAGLNLASKDLDVLARAYQGDNRSEIHYDRLLDDLAHTARAVMPDTSVHQVNGAHRRRLAMQRMFGSRLLAASQGNPRLAFSSCKGGDGRVTGASILAHLERNLGMQVSARDKAVLIAELKRAAPRASATGLNESAFSKVVLGQCAQPVTHALWEDEAKFDTREEFRQPRDLEQARVAAKLRDWAECRRHSLRDVYLQVIDRDRDGPLTAEKAVANLSRLGLSLTPAESQTLQRLIATNSGTCTFDSFAKPMASEEKKSSGLFPWQPRKSQPALVSSAFSSITPHVEQSVPRRAHATWSPAERQNVHETKTEQQEKPSGSTRESKRSTRHAIACVKTRRKSVNSAYLLMKQGQPLPAEDLYQRLCEADNASLDRADFDATLRSAGIAPSCPDIRFDQFNRLLAMDIKPEFSKSNDNPPPPPPTTTPPPSSPRTKVLHLRAAPPAPGIHYCITKDEESRDEAYDSIIQC